MRVSVVIPVCNEAATVEELAERLLASACLDEGEILFVDDGSTDGTGAVLDTLAEQHSRVRLLRFRRNQGKTAALREAFAQIQGDVVVTMDGDLQDDPDELPKLLAKLDEGYDLVCGWKQSRNDPASKTVPSRVYNAWVGWLFGLQLHDINTGFKVMHAEVARALPLYGDMHRLVAIHAAIQGYRVGEVPVTHHPRRHGHSKYGIMRFLTGAIDVIMVWTWSRFAEKPGQFLILTGLGTFVLAYAMQAAVAYLLRWFGYYAWWPVDVLIGVTTAAVSVLYGVAATSIVAAFLAEWLLARDGGRKA